MITLDELMVAYLVSFVLTFLVCSAYYIFFVRRPIRMLLMALHSSHDRHEFPAEIHVTQGPLSPLTRELNAFVKWADEMSSRERELKIRRQISADVAHDFRGPLTSIQGYTERLLEKGYNLPEDEARDYLKTILSNAQSLSQFVNSLLELAKIDAMVNAPKFQSFHADELIEQLGGRFRLGAAKKEISFDIACEKDLPLLYADRILIERALSNIIENAIYYTPSGGSVALKFSRASRRIEVDVQDTGIGIPPEDLPHVFDRFYRVDKDRSQRSGGTGLGLSIARAIIEAHGSAVRLESHIGKGTRVSFQLPAKNPLI